MLKFVFAECSDSSLHSQIVYVVSLFKLYPIKVMGNKIVYTYSIQNSLKLKKKNYSQKCFLFILSVGIQDLVNLAPLIWPFLYSLRNMPL